MRDLNILISIVNKASLAGILTETENIAVEGSVIRLKEILASIEDKTDIKDK